MYKETIKNAGVKMDKTIAVIQKDLNTLRAGAAPTPRSWTRSPWTTTAPPPS